MGLSCSRKSVSVSEFIGFIVGFINEQLRCTIDNLMPNSYAKNTYKMGLSVAREFVNLKYCEPLFSINWLLGVFGREGMHMYEKMLISLKCNPPIIQQSGATKIMSAYGL